MVFEAKKKKLSPANDMKGSTRKYRVWFNLK